MKNNIYFLATVVALFLFTSCKKNTTANTPPRTDIHLDSNAQVGTHIVDKDGKSLYFFSNDVNGGLANCTGGCLTSFPIFNADMATTTFGNGLLASDFKTITLTSGTPQTTYKGWPLYYFAQSGLPEPAGQTNGEGVGNIWFVAKTNYSIMIANNQLIGADSIHYLGTYTPGDGLTNYLCDGSGNTLYTFAKDSAFINKFTKADFSNNTVFPIYETANITVPSTLDKSLFVVTNVNGRNQLTYNGWPLYYFGADSLVKGSTKAITFPPSQPVGAIWPVAIKGEVPAPR